ncbi:TIGR03032 family protein [Thetidibacter halocola]|uniref:TIGR03032 family protein n=1 Tax=Thetidibacter halocola TaxID=2827239 RepID=A0A8J8B6A9_9RHOB|nr:TIGR03032 family protein [Thetidibacter halocola]MBS0123122.1 TIGR03032 family protein [Thetidibacter halocola]
MDEFPPFSITPSNGFRDWLHAENGSIAFTTYQVGKLFTVGINPDTEDLSVFERSFPKCMGLAVENSNGQTGLWVSTLFQLWRFQDLLGDQGQTEDGFDAVFVPLVGHTTGEIDVHDICPRVSDPDPLFVATRFNCLATLARNASFQPLWHPPFIDRIVPEDRCHLNGLAMRGGKPGFVTCVAAGNTAGAWRDHRRDGGIVIDVDSGAIVGSGLSMPHSPRWHDGTLYVLQSGSGEFGRMDLATGRFEPICFLPGFARGIALTGTHAIIGVSRPRRQAAFEGLALEDRLGRTGQEPQCMIAVVDLHSGEIAHSLVIEGVVRELYDVAIIPRVRRPKLLGFATPEIRFQIRPGPLAQKR